MYQLVKEESTYGTNGSDDNMSLDQRSKRLPMKLFRESCHAEQILQTLNSYRREAIFTDVVLMMDGQEFHCHRATLSANSTYFQAMFAEGLEEGCQGIVNLQAIHAPSMSLVLDYMYSGDVSIQEDNVEGLLELSSLLQIPRLKDACVAFLEGQLHTCNCLGIMRFASSFSISSLAEKSKRIALEGFIEVSHQEEFLGLDAKELEICLSSDWLAVPKEEVVFEALMRWVHHDVASRRGALKDLLEHVRLPLMDPLYLLEKVEGDKLIQESKECLPLLQEAHKSYILGTEVGSRHSRPRRFMELAEMIVVIGGCDKKGFLKLPFVDVFHPESRQWKPLSSMPGYTKSEFAACILKNDVYISGGHVNTRDVWLLSSQLNVWIKVAGLQKGRWRHKMAALCGKIYAVGGYDGVYRLASVECYDSFLNRWDAVAPLPVAVSSAAVVSYLKKLYVIGGGLDDNANTDKVQCYDPEENQWRMLSPAPFSQRCINAVSLDNLIYVVGGLLNQIFSYNPLKDTWTKMASLSEPLESCGVTICDGKIYILGGRDENGEGTDKVFAFDVATGSVEPQPPLQRCTSYHGCGTIL
ncbi:kelch-like protein 35 [Sceloporus undulatus]|uniref:kelch-like protein 35 n=1 Tax=Sceloporus undulatus TaxID=8520 RepID=UPI001C4C4FC3|nr:kelch-like protein 35 [Sceloporus undulatus]